MSKITMIQFTPWDKIYHFDSNNIDLSNGDKVVVKTEMGMEIGEVVGFKDVPSGGDSGCGCSKKEECPRGGCGNKGIKPVLRVADSNDFKKVPNKEEKEKAVDYCKKLIIKYELPMKLIDVHFSYDSSRITFAFIADTRVDFRELARDLTRHFNRTVRLQQIGIRDEAKMMGDFGHCGKQLCCRSFLNDLSSITSEMAELQQCAHRGSERISGMCGRLMCCLAYEQGGYKELADRMPPIGAKVDVDGKKGKIVGHHILKQSVNVLFSGGNGEEENTVMEIDLNRNK